MLQKGVQEQAGINIGCEVHNEGMPVLMDGGPNGIELCLLMLGPVGSAGTYGIDDVIGLQIEHSGADVKADGPSLVRKGFVSVVGNLGVLAVQIHGYRIALEVSVIDAEAVGSERKKLMTQILRIVLENLAEVLVYVVHFDPPS